MVVSCARNDQQSVMQLMFLPGLVLKPRRKRFMSKMSTHSTSAQLVLLHLTLCFILLSILPCKVSCVKQGYNC